MGQSSPILASGSDANAKFAPHMLEFVISVLSISASSKTAATAWTSDIFASYRSAPVKSVRGMGRFNRVRGVYSCLAAMHTSESYIRACVTEAMCLAGIGELGACRAILLHVDRAYRYSLAWSASIPIA